MACTILRCVMPLRRFCAGAAFSFLMPGLPAVRSRITPSAAGLKANKKAPASAGAPLRALVQAQIFSANSAASPM